MIDPSAIPSVPGVYQLVLLLPQTVTLRIGRLGTFTFPAGRYLYTGSALGGLRGRITRHLRADKRLHWHIDYLLPCAQVQEVRFYPTTERLECVLNRQALRRERAVVIVHGFGSSDCLCPSHLVHFREGS